MSVFVTVEDREGEGAFEVLELNRLIRHFKSIEGSVCARFISEDEDAIFNKSQNDCLIKELVGLRAKDLKKEEREELDALLKYCDKVQTKKNYLIKFYGERGAE
jgi:regulatory protein YycH of two-component signal transduction system YycFG